MSPNNDKTLLQRLLPVIILASLAGLVITMGWHKYLSLEYLAYNKQNIEAFTRQYFVLSVLGYALIYAVVVALSLPIASILTLFGGLFFGGLLGGITTVVAATLGALIVFLIARSSLGDVLAARAGKTVEKLREGFQDHALNYLLFLRLVPVFPFWLVNIAPALLGVTTFTYTLGTFLGIIPGTLAYAFVGAGLGSVIEAQQKAYETCLLQQGVAENATHPACSLTLDTSALVTPELVGAFIGLGIVALIPIILQKFRKTPSQKAIN